jgi:oligoribonuclease (3'-5' exoribonuclease)
MLAWTNILTTSAGEFPYGEKILDIGIIVSNEGIGRPGEKPYKFRGAVGYPVKPEGGLADTIATMDPLMYMVAVDNGLTEQLMHEACPDSDKVQEECIELLSRFGEPGSFVLAGSDTYWIRSWLRELMPDLYEMYSDRSVDLNYVADFPEIDVDEPLRAIQAANYEYNLYLESQGVEVGATI